MTTLTNPIVETYSRLAEQYDDQVNVNSCWGRATERALASIVLRDEYQVVIDVGCGTGKALAYLAPRSPGVRFIGVDPAENMRLRALQNTRNQPNIEILRGCFEELPFPTESIDYLYSILAFHWTTDVQRSVKETARVLKPTGEMDLFFIGRHNGREFIQKTTPIFLKYMGPARLLESARMRKQLTKEEALALFSNTFSSSRVSVEESYECYYDTLEGHMGWWLRIEGHFVQIPPDKRQECDRAVKHALASLAGARGIPYTIHQLHVKVRNPE